MGQIYGAGQPDTDNQNAEALQAALAQRQVTLQGQPQGGSDVPIHQNSDPVSDESEILRSFQPLTEKRRVLCGAQGDALELLQLAEEVLDQVPPFVHLAVNVERRRAARMLGDDGLGAALVQVRDNVIAVESGIADQRPKGEPVNERRHAHRVEALPWQEHEAHQIAERVGERQDLGGQAAFGAANSLALRPPFAPCPWRWTLTMVASTRAYSRSGSSETASNRRCQTSAFTQSRKRVKTLFQWPNKGGRSRQGLPVRTIHSTASTNRRLSLPLRPGSPGLPRQRGSICAHWSSVSTKRSIRGVNHSPAPMKSVNPNRP